MLVVQAFELHPILVCDPVCPTNNVAKGCYRIAQIQRVFQQAADETEVCSRAPLTPNPRPNLHRVNMIHHPHPNR